MYPSVQAGFRAFNEKFEGSVSYMYLDVKGLITVGVGNLIDRVEDAQALPFRLKNKPGIATPGAAATKEQIAAEWTKLKANYSLASQGHRACEPLTDLELSEESIDVLIGARLSKNEDFLKRQPSFESLETWPADAQLGLLSMAWAMGPGGPGQFTNFRAACRQLDFNAAAQQCKMSEEGNPGVIPRNRANLTLFSNAAAVLAGGMERSVLYYPEALANRTAMQGATG